MFVANDKPQSYELKNKNLENSELTYACVLLCSCVCVCVCAYVHARAQLCLNLFDPMDSSLLGFSVHSMACEPEHLAILKKDEICNENNNCQFFTLCNEMYQHL